MKTRPFQLSVTRRRALCFVTGSLIASMMVAGAVLWSSSAAAHSSEPAPLIAILTPHEGASLNAATLRVQALVAAVKARNGETFVFNAQTIAGRNAGRVRRVELTLDSVPIQSIDTADYGRQFVTDFRVDLSALSDGLHLLTIKAVQDGGRDETSATVTFTLNRSLVQPETNRIEEAATPNAFAGMRVRGWDGRDDDDQEDEDPWQCPPHFDLKGTLALSNLSDGVDLATDRVVVALGSQVTAFEPGTLRCNGQEKTCRFEDASASFVRFIELKRKGDGRWKFRLRGTGALPADARSLYLRIGNDWGGIDLATGERLVGLRPNLDMSHQAQAMIGTGGGTIETVDSAGVIIRLQIPAGALTVDTLIKVTPLLSSPLPDSSAALHPGVKFEPEGLQFAEAATLTMDFSATNQTIGNQHSLLLLTSPITELPLYGTNDPATKTLTAHLYHFSAAAPGAGSNGYMDLRRWAASLLLGTRNLSISELELLAAALVAEQRSGCTHNCLDAAQFTQLVSNSIAALVAATCPTSVTNPTDQALNRLLLLEGIGSGMGVDTNAIGLRSCMEQVFRALIEAYGAQALTDPSTINLTRLLNSSLRAQQLGFNNLETLALTKLAAAMRVLIFRAEQLCPTDKNRALAQFAFIQGYLPVVASVDPTLAGDIQNAISNCGGGSGSFSLTVEPFGEAYLQGCGGPSRRILPPTLNLTCSDQRTNITFTLSKGPNNTLTVDAFGSAAENSASRAKISGRFAVNEPGRVAYELNPNWGVGYLDVGVITSPLVLLPLDVFGRNFFPWDPNPFHPLTGSTDFLPGVYDFSFIMNIDGPAPGACDTPAGPQSCAPNQGSGRLLTLTFTPSP